MTIGLPEFVINPENRCPVILLLDTSSSMQGKPINELNNGLVTSLFNSEVHQNLKSIHRILQKEFDSQDIF